jgi:hypothetical protein
MKHVLKPAAMLALSFPALAGSSATLTTDPLTKLPLILLIDLDNAPMRLPDTQMCKSKMQTDFYSLDHGKLSATIAWYGAHLSGFHKTHAYGVDRSQDTFYNADGTVIVSITGEPGKNGEDVDAHSVVYARFQPGLSEKEIVGVNSSHLVCN